MDKPELYRLIEKYIDKRASREERAQLMKWYQSAGGQRVEWTAYSEDEEEMVRKRILRQLQRRLAGAERDEAISGERPLPGKIVRFAYLRVSVAAAILLVIGLTALLISKRQFREDLVEVYNPAGRISHLQLPDGTEIWLNANSRLWYAKEYKNSRDVRLVGEAFFDVHPASRPFIVHTDKLDTRVLGTAFTVEAYPNEGQNVITVKDGKVSVARVGRGSGLTVLMAGQQVIYDTLTSVAVVNTIVLGDGPDWKSGELRFRSQKLDKIATQLENWYGYRFFFAQDTLKRYVYDASFKNSISLKELLGLLCEINNIRFSIDDAHRQVNLSSNKAR